MIKYYASSWGGIEAVKVIRETESSVWISRNGRREAKRTNGASYCDTPELAREFLVKLIEERIRTSKDRIKAEMVHISREELRLEEFRNLDLSQFEEVAK